MSSKHMQWMWIWLWNQSWIKFLCTCRSCCFLWNLVVFNLPAENAAGHFKEKSNGHVHSLWDCMSVFMQLHRQEYSDSGGDLQLLTKKPFWCLHQKYIYIFKVLITSSQELREVRVPACICLKQNLFCYAFKDTKFQIVNLSGTKTSIFGSFSFETLPDVWRYFFLGCIFRVYIM